MAGPIRIAILANGSQARRELDQTAGTATAMGRSFGKLGGIIAGAFAVREIAHFGAELVSAATQFQSSMTRIQTQAGASAADVAKLSKEVLALGGKVTQSPEQLAESLYHLKSVGLDNVKAMQALKQASNFASVGGADLEETTNALAGAWRSGIKGAGSFKQAVATMNAIIGAGNMKMEDLNAALGSGFLPSARSFGLSLKDVGSALALMTDEGIPAAAAATRLRMSFSLLGAPSKAAEKQLATIGLTGKALATELREGGLVGAIGLLKDHLKDLSKVDASQVLSRAFGGGRSSSAILTLINNFDVLRLKEKQVANTSDLDRFSKSVKKNAQTSAQVIGRFKSAIDTLKVEAGTALLPLVSKVLTPLTAKLIDIVPAMQDIGSTARGELAPAIQSAGRALTDYGKAAVSAGKPLASLLNPALKVTASLANVTANVLDAIPGPLKSIGVEAGIAALLLPRLTAGVTAATTAIADQITYLRVLKLEMSDTAGRASLVGASLSRLGQVAKQGAGIGGILLLAQSAHQSNAELGLMEKTAGGAALGFSVGGPWGAAIGAVGGLAVGVLGVKKSLDAEQKSLDATSKALKRADDAMDGSKPHIADYAKTLDQVTGAATAATRASVLQKLQQDHIVDQAATLGLSARTLVNATLGQKSALDKVNDAWKRNGLLLDAAATSNISTWIENQNTAFQGTRQQILENSAAVTKYSKKLLNELPRRLRTYVSATGIQPTARAIAGLAQQFHAVDNKTIRALIQLSGADTTVKQVERIIARLKDTGQQKMSPQWKQSVDAGVAAGRASADKGVKGANDKLHQTGRITTDMSPFLRSLAGGLNKAKGQASSGGVGIGNALKAGLLTGMAGMAARAASEAASAVAQAVAAAKAKGKISSPSKETLYIGEMLGEGLIVGLRSKVGPVGAVAAQMTQGITDKIDRRGPKAVSAMTRLAKAIAKAAAAAVGGGSDLKDLLSGKLGAVVDKQIKALKKYLDAHTKLTDSEIDKKAAKARKDLDAQNKKLLASTKDQRAALVAQEAALGKVNDKIADAKSNLADLIQTQKDYAASVRDAVVASGDITQVLGEDVPVTAANIIAGLQAKSDAVDQYVKSLLDLKNLGLNATTLQQLLDAGVSGGLATAQAIEAGGSAAVQEINDLTASMTAAGSQLGTSMSHTMYDAGIQAAQGLLAGLQSQKKQLQAVAEQMADELVKAVKKGLKIHSPSQVFRDIGKQTVAGLALGVDQTYVRRTGALMSASLQKGFAQPELTATAVLANGAGAGSQPISVTFTAEQLSALQRGRAIQADLDVYESAGGRRRAS